MFTHTGTDTDENVGTCTCSHDVDAHSFGQSTCWGTLDDDGRTYRADCQCEYFTAR